MKCKSCESHIDPKFKHAISQNMCPFCGGHIMDDQLKHALVTLSNLMIENELYLNDIQSWLFSNYNFVSLNDPNLKDKIPESIKQSLIDEGVKKAKENIKESLVELKSEVTENSENKKELIVKNEKEVAEFFRKAGIKSPEEISERTQRLKSIVEKVKYANQNEEESESEYEPESEGSFEEVQSIINNQHYSNKDFNFESAKPNKDLLRLEQMVAKSRKEPNFRGS